jgi:peptidoglycan/xylan/chitin deacetylase (PgdA/CDA1 family)
MYHRVSEIPKDVDPLGIVVTPEKFHHQMSLLYEANFECVNLRDAIQGWKRENKYPKKSFIITFDDGYKDFIIHAWPILQQYNFTATVFLVTELIGCESNWEKQAGQSSAELLSWDDIRCLYRLGCTFGSHTLSHPNLTLLDSKQAIDEIGQSKLIIEDHLGIPIDLFSYPFGISDTHIQELVSKNGYIGACGVDRGSWGKYNLWRSECRGSDNDLSFYWKVYGYHFYYIWFREQFFLGKILVSLKNNLRKIILQKRK